MRSEAGPTVPGNAPDAGETADARRLGGSATHPVGLRPAPALRLDDARAESFIDSVVEETPVALLYNGAPFAVMMATPVDLEDFALGFALTEGVVEHPGEFRFVERTTNARGVALHAAIPQHRFDALEGRARALAGRSGCGLCGTESLDAAIRPVRRLDDASRIPAASIGEGLHRLAQSQPLNRASGGVHAAGYVHAGGILVREDVGRHNALDKLVGALARADRGPGFLVITSRASYEIVHKAASAGMAVVVAMSAPTDLAIRLAEEAGITLVAFARGRTMTVYTRADRIVHG